MITYKEKLEKFSNKSAMERFDTKTPRDFLPFKAIITNGMRPDSNSNISLNAVTLWCKFLDGEWFRPYGQFSEVQINKMIEICKNDQQIVCLMSLLSATEL